MSPLLVLYSGFSHVQPCKSELRTQLCAAEHHRVGFALRFVAVASEKRAAPAAKQGQGRRVITRISCSILVAKFKLLNKHRWFDLTNAK